MPASEWIAVTDRVLDRTDNWTSDIYNQVPEYDLDLVQAIPGATLPEVATPAAVLNLKEAGRITDTGVTAREGFANGNDDSNYDDSGSQSSSGVLNAVSNVVVDAILGKAGRALSGFMNVVGYGAAILNSSQINGRGSNADFEDRVLILLGDNPKKWQHVRQSRLFVFGGSGNPKVKVVGPTVVVYVRGGSVDDVAKAIENNSDVGITQGTVDPFAFVDDALAKIKQKRKEVGGQLESLIRDTVRTLPGGEGAILLERILSGTVKEQYGAEIGAAWEQLLALPQSAWNDPNHAGKQLAVLYFVGKIHKKLDVDSPEHRKVEELAGAVPKNAGTLFTNRLRYRFAGNAVQLQRYRDDLADLRRQYGSIVPSDEVGIVNGRIAYGSFDPATGRISIFRGGDDLTEFEELLHWKFHNERLANSGWTQAEFLRRWNDSDDVARAAFRRQYYDAAESEIPRILREIYGWVPR